MSEEVLYEERDSIAIITLNRPDRLNTLTEGVVQGVADECPATLTRAALGRRTMLFEQMRSGRR